MPSGYGVEDATTTQVVAAWVVPPSNVQAVAVSPGWCSLGSYYLPRSCMARLDVVHFVTDSGLTSRVRLFDQTAGTVVSGSTSSTALAPERTLGGIVELTGGHVYQVQAECTGSNISGRSSVILSATISD